jgi:hypothetical protein
VTGCSSGAAMASSRSLATGREPADARVKVASVERVTDLTQPGVESSSRAWASFS